VILHVDRDRRVAAGDQVDAVAERFGGRRRVRRGSGRGGTAASLRRLNRDRRVRLHVGDGQVEDRIAALLLDDMHRALPSADVLVVGVERLEGQVAEERVVDPRLDALDQTLVVDVAVHLGLVVTGEADDVVLLAANRLGFDGRALRRGGAQESVRHHHDLELLRPRRLGVDDDRLVHRLLADDRLLAAAVRRILALRPHALDARRAAVEVDRPRVALVDELRPRRAGIRRLAEREVEPGCRELHCLERAHAHRLGRVRDHRAGVLRRWTADEHRHHRQSCCKRLLHGAPAFRPRIVQLNGMTEYKPQQLDKKWQQTWTASKAFEVDLDPSRPKFYALEMFAYPSGYAHVGHVRNYIIGDVMARTKRMRGYNLLHP